MASATTSTVGNDQRLAVGIIGAGIAGLSAAIAMRRAGWDVELFERSKFKNEVGAAVTIGCNGTRVLRHFGADFEKWGATQNLQVRMPDGKTLNPIWSDSFADVPQKYGDKWLFFHRQDLHSGLRELAQDPKAAEAPPVKLNLDAEVVKLAADAGSFRLANGRTVTKDLVIIANGIHCNFIETVTGQPSQIIKTGRSIYRCLIPMEKVMSDPLIAPLYEDQVPGLLGPNIRGYNTICGTYHCRNNTVLNVAFVHPTKPEELDNEDWNRPASIEDIAAVTHDFHPAIQAIPKKATDIGCYNQMTRQEVPTFIKGKAVLIGDAAHSMLTFHAQGATMSIESTGALEIFFNTKDVTDVAAIATRLRQFNEFRLPRCLATQIMSNGGHGALGDPSVHDRIRKYYTGPLPPSTTKPWGEGFRDFFFSYDIFKESRKFIAEQGNMV